jgi:hypothetical protein
MSKIFLFVNNYRGRLQQGTSTTAIAYSGEPSENKNIFTNTKKIEIVLDDA